MDHNIVNYKWSSWKRPTNTQLILSPLLLSRKLGIDRSNEEIIVDKDGIAKVDVIPGCFFIIKVSVLEEMNFFDEGTFLYQEENIIAFKLSKLNKGYYSAIYVKDYYFHNHVNNKFTNKLKGRIKSTKVYNDSLEYLLKNYYNNNLLLLLKISIILSYIEIFIIHILSSIKQFIRK